MLKSSTGWLKSRQTGIPGANPNSAVASFRKSANMVAANTIWYICVRTIGAELKTLQVYFINTCAYEVRITLIPEIDPVVKNRCYYWKDC